MESRTYKINNKEYIIYENGEIFNCKTKKYLKPFKSKTGYLQVTLQSKTYYMHRLVCEAFHGECPDKMVCCHNDGNPLNNHSSNLRWDTQLSNSNDKKKHGTWICGSVTYNAKLNESDVTKIRELYKNGLTQVALANRFNVSQSIIHKVVTRQTWVHI